MRVEVNWLVEKKSNFKFKENCFASKQLNSPVWEPILSSIVDAVKFWDDAWDC